MSLAADGQDGNGLQLQTLRLNVSSCFRASSKIDINGRGFVISLRISLYLSVQMSKDIMFCTG